MQFCDRRKEGRLPGEKVGGIGVARRQVQRGKRAESWSLLEPSWGLLEWSVAILGHLGAVLGPLGAVVNPLGTFLGWPGSLMERSWGL